MSSWPTCSATGSTDPRPGHCRLLGGWGRGMWPFSSPSLSLLLGERGGYSPTPYPLIPPTICSVHTRPPLSLSFLTYRAEITTVSAAVSVMRGDLSGAGGRGAAQWASVMVVAVSEPCPHEHRLHRSRAEPCGLPAQLRPPLPPAPRSRVRRCSFPPKSRTPVSVSVNPGPWLSARHLEVLRTCLQNLIIR